MSTKPDYASKVKAMVALGPAVYGKFLRNKPLKFCVALIASFISRIAKIAAHWPQSTSVKSMCHGTKCIYNKRFERFDYGDLENHPRYGTHIAPLYDLSLVSVPVATFYSNDDELCSSDRYKTVVTIYQVGYLISLCALILSLIIFCCFRCLECTRVRIHKHLFVSFIMNNILWLVWYRNVMNESTPVNQLNQFWCTALHVLVQYFLVANYFWMFCEGFYLHTLLVYAFTRAESNLLKGFYVFGWLGPSIPVTLYTIFRALDFDSNEQKDCWIHESQWTLFLSVPVCVCLVVSLAFLINILRVLLIKLNANRRTLSMSTRRESTVAENTASLRKESEGAKSSIDDEDVIILSESALASCLSWGSHQGVTGFWVTLIQAARATLILIPLLGLHYFIIPFRPDPHSQGAIYYEYIAAISSSLQGLAVSLLFCFCNGEVMAALKRKFSRHYCPGKMASLREQSYARTTVTTMNLHWPLSETRREALEDALKENKDLHKSVEHLEKVNAIVEEMIQKAKKLAEIITTMSVEGKPDESGFGGETKSTGLDNDDDSSSLK